MLKKLLFSTVALSLIALLGYSQQFGVVELNKGDDDMKLLGFDIDFSDASVITGGFKSNDYITPPVINEGDSTLIITTNTHADTTNWWTWGNLQFFEQNIDDTYAPFVLTEDARASFTITTPVELGFNMKLDQTDWAEGFSAIEYIDTVKTLNERVTIEVDFAKIASNAVDLSSEDYTTFYLWFYAIDGTVENEIKLHRVLYGSFMPAAPVGIGDVNSDGSINIIDALNSSDVEQIEVLNIFGQVKQVCRSAKEITKDNSISIVKIINKDGSVVTGSIANF